MTEYLNEEYVRSAAAKFNGELTHYAARDEVDPATYLVQVVETGAPEPFDREAFASYVLGGQGDSNELRNVGHNFKSFILKAQKGRTDRNADLIFDDFDTTVWIITFLG